MDSDDIKETIYRIKNPDVVKRLIEKWNKEDNDYELFVERYGNNGSFNDYLEFIGQKEYEQ